MSDQVPSLLLMPAESVASLGMPLMTMVGAFWSVSAAEVEMPRATVWPSSTVSAVGAARFGASACSLTVTLMVAVEVAAVSVSVSVAVTVRVMAWVDSPVVRVRPES